MIKSVFSTYFNIKTQSQFLKILYQIKYICCQHDKKLKYIAIIESVLVIRHAPRIKNWHLNI